MIVAILEQFGLGDQDLLRVVYLPDDVVGDEAVVHVVLSVRHPPPRPVQRRPWRIVRDVRAQTVVRL